MTISPGPGMGIAQYLGHAIPFSLQAFGDGTRHQGVCRHILKELDEVQAARNANDETSILEELIDVAILGMDGAWRALMFAGGAPFDGARVTTVAADVEAMVLEGLIDAHPYSTLDDQFCAMVAYASMLRRDCWEGQITTPARFAGISALALNRCYQLMPEHERQWLRVKEHLYTKLHRNMGRTWPDWRTISPDQPIEHVRTGVRS